jgi:pimeloyl-ACP methyl ester carboxylesterase
MRNLRLYLFAIVLFAFLATAQEAPAATGTQCRALFGETLDLDQYLEKSGIEVDGRTVYLEHFRAEKNKPTAVVFMGLFTPMSDLVAFQREFIRQSDGEGLLIFTYSTQTESLIWRTYAQRLSVGDPKIDLIDLVREGTAAVNAAGLRGPVTAIGYSFGSIPAAEFATFHRSRVNSLILAAPFVEVGEHSPELLSGKAMLEGMAALNPFFGSSILESARDSAAQNMAASIVNDTYGSTTFPDKLKRTDIISAVKAQIRSIETANLQSLAAKDWPSTDFFLAENENPSRMKLQLSAAEAAEKANHVGRVTVFKGGAHPLLADKPRKTAAATLAILRGKKPRP